MIGMGWMMLGMVLFWGLVIFLAVLFVGTLFETGEKPNSGKQNFAGPMEYLDLRYSRGEITREQYMQIRKDLEETPLQG